MVPSVVLSVLAWCVSMTNVQVQRKDVLSPEEVDASLDRADELDPYSRLRAKALLSIFYKTGKRRREVATLELDDLERKDDQLSITFTVVKKRKGHTVTKRRTKLISLDDPFAQHIIDYLEYMTEKHPNCRYLFPSTRSVFGAALHFYENKHISGRQVLRIMKSLNPECWCHLFRETVGAKIVRSDPTIMAPFRVMRRLDLESHVTAFRYMQRYASDVIESEEKREQI